MTRTPCSIPGCEGLHYARGWCVTHYRRWTRTGDPAAAQPIRATTGDSYAGALQRMRQARGPVTDHRCADCGAAAACWSYDGTDPDERTDARRGTRYSLDPARYRPRCRACLRRATAHGGRSTDLDPARVTALYRAGASARGIAAHLGTTATVITRVLREHHVPIRPAGRPSRTPRRTNTH